MNGKWLTDMAASVIDITNIEYHSMNPTNLQVPSFCSAVLPKSIHQLLLL